MFFLPGDRSDFDQGINATKCVSAASDFIAFDRGADLGLEGYYITALKVEQTEEGTAR